MMDSKPSSVCHGARSPAHGLVRVVVLVTLLSASVADAVPGRSWAPIQRLDHANHSVMRAEFFSASRGDSLELVAIGFEGVTPFRFYGLVWQDSAWMERWHADAAPLAYVRPVDDRVGRSFVWIHPDALTEDCGTRIWTSCRRWPRRWVPACRRSMRHMPIIRR